MEKIGVCNYRMLLLDGECSVEACAELMRIFGISDFLRILSRKDEVTESEYIISENRYLIEVKLGTVNDRPQAIFNLASEDKIFTAKKSSLVVCEQERLLKNQPLLMKGCSEIHIFEGTNRKDYTDTLSVKMIEDGGRYQWETIGA